MIANSGDAKSNFLRTVLIIWWAGPVVHCSLAIRSWAICILVLSVEFCFGVVECRSPDRNKRPEVLHCYGCNPSKDSPVPWQGTTPANPHSARRPFDIKPTQRSSWTFGLLISQSQTFSPTSQWPSPQEVFVCNHLFYCLQRCGAPYCAWCYFFATTRFMWWADAPHVCPVCWPRVPGFSKHD